MNFSVYQEYSLLARLALISLLEGRESRDVGCRDKTEEANEADNLDGVESKGNRETLLGGAILQDEKGKRDNEITRNAERGAINNAALVTFYNLTRE